MMRPDRNELFRMDAGELREWVGYHLSDGIPDERLGYAIDRLASIGEVDLPQLLRDLADDIEEMRA